MILRATSCFLALAVPLAIGVPMANAQDCQKEQLAAAVDQAGDSLRSLTRETQPRIDAAMRQLKAKRGWSDADYEEKAYEALQDEKIATFDTSANELLEKIDSLGASGAAATVPCGRIADVETSVIELKATIRAKTTYVLARLEKLIGTNASADTQTSSVATVPPAAAAGTGEVKSPPAKPAIVVEPPASKAATKSPEAKSGNWSTTTAQIANPPPSPLPVPPPAPVLLQPLPKDMALPPVEADRETGYSIDEIQSASEGAFGKVSAGIGGLLEHAFRKSGRPTAYILGEEGGGAFLAGLRYGKGTLYLRAGGTMPIYWHGPSLGTDFGASGSKTMFLIYRLNDPDDLIASFTGVDGSAYVVGGLGLTFMSNGRIQMAPIRSGLGLRLGANIGYVRFTRRPTWNPF
jgi:hypothetical protein